MSENQERDSHFAGFAKVLLQELMEKYDHLPPGEWSPAEKDELIIARRAYDLAVSIINLVPVLVQTYPDLRTAEEVVAVIPDFTEWPNTSRS